FFCSTSRTSTFSVSSTSALTIISMASRISYDPMPGVLGLGGGSTFSFCGCFDQTADSVGRLCALLDPVVDPSQVQLDLGRIPRRIVGAKILQIRAVAF